jgi:hypothetical protein
VQWYLQSHVQSGVIGIDHSRARLTNGGFSCHVTANMKLSRAMTCLIIALS